MVAVARASGLFRFGLNVKRPFTSCAGGNVMRRANLITVRMCVDGTRRRLIVSVMVQEDGEDGAKHTPRWPLPINKSTGLSALKGARQLA